MYVRCGLGHFIEVEFCDTEFWNQLNLQNDETPTWRNLDIEDCGCGLSFVGTHIPFSSILSLPPGGRISQSKVGEKVYTSTINCLFDVNTEGDQPVNGEGWIFSFLYTHICTPVFVIYRVSFLVPDYIENPIKKVSEFAYRLSLRNL